MPLLGLIADNHRPRGAFVVLAAIPLLAMAMSTTLPEPAHDIFPSDT
jgi:FSR family fosmidomycin resistance protein-like MFS transporter